MATFTFDGTESITTPFNTAVDRVIFNLNAADFAVITEDRSANTVSFVTTSGAVLTLTNTNFEAIQVVQDQALVPGIDSDIIFDIGTRGESEALTGNVVVGLQGVDIVTGLTGEAGNPGGLLLGNQGADVISNGNLFSVRMFGGQGNDTLNLETANGSDASLLVGGLGNDTVNVIGDYTGNVTIFGGNEANDPTDGADEINVSLGSGGTALIYGNGGNDDITVTAAGGVAATTAGMATVFGGQGNDTITADVEGGLFVGGLGTDTIDIDSVGTEGNAFTVFGGNGLADAADGRDVITLTLQENDTALVYGNGGNDLINLDGAGGEVSVFGGQGNDQISGNVGDNSLVVGGLGSDVIDIDVLNTTPGEGDIATGSSVTVFGGNGMADAADGADLITVDLDGNPRASGVEGAAAQTAEIFGNGGDDTIILTGQGAASVHGGQGDDILSIEGNGLYTLTGGQGADRFDFSNATGTVAGVNGGTFTTTTVAADVSRITDLNFDEDELDFGNDVQFVANVSGTATTGANLSVAANTAFAQATSTTQGGLDAAVIFSYQGQQYLVSGEVGANPSEPGGTDGTPDVLTALINITGFTGTIGTDDFVSTVGV